MRWSFGQTDTMRLLPTCFKAFLRSLSIAMMLLAPVEAAWGASVRGEIQIVSGNGRAPGQQQGDPSDVVVWLEPVTGASVQPVQSLRARLLQKDKMFRPHVLPILVGTVVDFPNADPIFHNAFSQYNGQLFDLSLYPPGTSKSIRFRRPGIVRVFCNIHPTMSAVIVVLDTPYFTKAKRDGSYQLANVLPGTYELHVFDERATLEAAQTVQISLPSEESEVHAATAKISEAGYVTPPHKNKYGLDYPAGKEAESYGGVPK